MGAGPSHTTGGSGYATGNMNMNMNGRVGGIMSGEGRWWEAFGTGGFEGEPSLMEGELQPFHPKSYHKHTIQYREYHIRDMRPLVAR